MAEKIIASPRVHSYRHPSGLMMSTPLLIPSFSSKGFMMKKNKDKEESEIQTIFDVASEVLTECMLVSAYDLHYKYLDFGETNPTDFIFLDSGGYETFDDHDLSTIMRHTVQPKDWVLERYMDTLNRWGQSRGSTIMVSFDHGSIRKPFSDQISEAQKLCSQYKHNMSTFLLKPEKRENLYVRCEEITPFIEELRHFDIIGVTEKELGSSILDRMVAIYKLRYALDDKGIQSPIHVFGSLDPISSVLYFIAGAEIFDGLTWIRYAYYQGAAVYRETYCAMQKDVKIHHHDVIARTLRDNIYYLSKLKSDMTQFADDMDFKIFDTNAEVVRYAYKELKTKVGK